MVYIQTKLSDTSLTSDDIRLSEVNTTTQKPRTVDLGGLVHKTSTEPQKKTLNDIRDSLSQAGISALIRTGISIQQIERGYRGKSTNTGNKETPEFMTDAQAGIIEKHLSGYSKDDLVGAKIAYNQGDKNAWAVVGAIKAAQEAATEANSEPDFSAAQELLDQTMEG